MTSKEKNEVEKLIDLEKRDGQDVFTNYEPIKSDLDDDNPPADDSGSE